MDNTEIVLHKNVVFDNNGILDPKLIGDDSTTIHHHPFVPFHPPPFYMSTDSVLFLFSSY